MRWNATRHTKRPPASNKGARCAWDYFVKDESRVPKEMTYKFMDYWVWVMEFTDGDYEEIDGLVIAHRVRDTEVNAKVKKTEAAMAWLDDST